MQKRMNKKGADIAIGTIVVIILALVVLVVVIYGFTVGWGNLFQNIVGFGGGEVNVQTHVRSCQVSCSTQSTFEYCSKKRSIVFDKGQKAIPDVTCENLALRNVGLECDEIDCTTAVVGHSNCAKWPGEVISDTQCGLKVLTHAPRVYNDLTDQGLTCCVEKKDTCKAWGGNAVVVDSANDATNPCKDTTQFTINELLKGPDEKVAGDGEMAGKNCCVKRSRFV